METAFQYVRVGRKLITDICERVRRGASSVILGHPFAGKGYLCDLILRDLDLELTGRLVRLNFGHGATVSTEREFRDRVANAVQAVGGHEIRTDGTLLDPIDRLPHPMPVLVVQNLDSVTHDVGRVFLQEVRPRVEDDRLTVILTGEYNLRELVHGPNSEFEQAAQYVLQGFELDEFSELLREFSNAYGVEFDRPDDAANELCNLTGGNRDVLRNIFIGILDSRLYGGLPRIQPVHLAELRKQTLSPGVVASVSRVLLRHLFRLIPQEPRSWDNLGRLIRGERAPLRSPNGPPGPLTLSGVARREDGYLVVSGPLIRACLQYYYDATRLGDLYAGAGEWEKAFEHYRNVPIGFRRRPTTAHDRPRIDHITRILDSLIHSSVLDSSRKLREVFAEAVSLVYGCAEVVFLQRMDRWQVIPVPALPQPSASAQKACSEILTESDATGSPHLQIETPWKGAVLGARLQGIWNDQPFAVLLGDFNSGILFSAEREKLIANFLANFCEAHDKATALQRDRLLLQMRNLFSRITADIVSALGSQILDVDGILKSAAAGLVTLGYRRVFFSLVDPLEKHINGVWDQHHPSEPDQVDLASLSKWPLDPATADIQPHAVQLRRPIIVADARTSPITDKDIVARADMCSIAVVPLVTGTRRVLGTVHIERLDRGLVSQEEVGELFEFGHSLAALIEQGERTHLLQEALDKVPSPLLLIDACKRIRYANRACNDVYPAVIPSRWYLTDVPIPSELGAIGDDLRTALSGHLTEHHVKALDQKHWGVVTNFIHNWRGETAGAFLHIQDLTYFYGAFDALKRLASAHSKSSCVERLLEATRKLGHRWGRVYMVDRQNADELRSCKQYADDRDVNNIKEAASFDSGGYVLQTPPKDALDESWYCIRKEPAVFCFTGSTDEFRTKHGLTVIGVANPHCSGILRKTHKEYWVDLPLMGSRGAIGKISLQCNEDLRPEQFEFLKALSSMASVVMEGFGERADWIRREAAEQTLGQLTHTIGTRFAWLWPQLSAYERFSENYPSLNPLNQELASGLRDLDGVLGRAKHLLRGFVPRLKTVDVSALVRDCAKGVANVSFSGIESLVISADPDLLKDAFTEIIGNSLRFQHRQGKPHLDIDVHVALSGEGEIARVTIADKGRGIPANLKDRIWDAFFTYNPTGKLGTGLGLDLVRRVVRAHGGACRENGTPGEGARFEIDLPKTTGTALKKEQEPYEHLLGRGR